MRILIVTDAWVPQVNGVVRTLQMLAEALKLTGVETGFLTPDRFKTIPLPSYPEIRVALTTPGALGRRIEAEGADHVHIATEGPLGILARVYCVKRGKPFTTSYHTRFPEYVSARAPVPASWLYGAMRWFHNAGNGTMVAAPSMAAELRAKGFTKIAQWSRGVDCEAFDPALRQPLDWQAPIFLNVGRVAVEKNLPAFLDLDLPGTKVIVGDGPELETLRSRYPDAVFLGALGGRDLARIYASADVFVFPSRTDTFGNVLLEALASGLPVAAYPVTGPIDVLGDGVGGVLHDDLRLAALSALRCNREAARAKALTYSWEACAALFLDIVQRAQSAADWSAANGRMRRPVTSGAPAIPTAWRG